MASTTQIVPKFQHPHVYTIINDNTQYVDTRETPVDRSYKFIAVFRSGKGVANKLVKMQDLNSFINHFGKSNYAKYGQPSIDALISSSVTKHITELFFVVFFSTRDIIP